MSFPSRSFRSARAFFCAAACLSAAAGIHAVTLGGKVTFAGGGPVAGATVTLPRAAGPLQTVTNGQGDYSLSVEEGGYDHLRVGNAGTEIAGFPRQADFVFHQELLVSGNTVKNMVLPAFFRVHGVLRAPGGTPLAGVRLVMTRWNGEQAGLPNDEYVTDGAGGYELFSMEGQARITVPEFADSALASFPVILQLTADTVVVGADTVFDRDTAVDLAYTRTPVLSGKVMTADSAAVAGIAVVMIKDGLATEKRTDSLGFFSFPLVSPGTVTALRARAVNDTLGQVPSHFDYLAHGGFPVTADLEKHIVLPRFPLFSGRLSGAGGTPIANASVTGSAWSGGLRRDPRDSALTDSAGRFALRCALDSNQFLIAPPANSPYERTTLDFTISRDSTADMVLARNTVLTGKVVLADSTPAAGIQVSLRNTGRGGSAQSDSTGRFRLPILAGSYTEFRAGNAGMDIPGVPRRFTHTVQSETLALADSAYRLIVLPRFTRLAGKVYNADSQAVADILITSAFRANGAGQEPMDESLSAPDGSYELFLPPGENRIAVEPPSSLPYAAAAFTLTVDDAVARNIVLNDSGNALTRVQPSVAGRGRSGKILVTGSKTRFTEGVDSLQLGGGVTATGIAVLSDLLLSARISIADTVTPGLRSVRVFASRGIYIGPDLLRVTAPAQADLDLDSDGKLRQAVMLLDGTGTQLKVDSGTAVRLPAGTAATLFLEAPFIKNEQAQPLQGVFLQVQREFRPAGTVFDPPAILTYQYQDQDVAGFDESRLIAFKYDNEGDSVIAEYPVIGRIPGQNLLRQEVGSFSLFRLAQSHTAIAVLPPKAGRRSGPPGFAWIKVAQIARTGRLKLDFRTEGTVPAQLLRFRLAGWNGARSSELRVAPGASADYAVEWQAFPSGRPPATGIYLLIAESGGHRMVRSVALGL